MSVSSELTPHDRMFMKDILLSGIILPEVGYSKRNIMATRKAV